MTEEYDMSPDDSNGTTDVANGATAPSNEVSDNTLQPSEAEKAHVQKILACIKEDKRHFKKTFDRMRADMHMAMHGCDIDWTMKNYKAPIVGRHISQKTSALYAKNPKIVARRKEMLDFTVWDETPESIVTAMQVLQANAPLIQARAAATQQYQAALAAMQSMMPPAQVDPATGQPIAPLGTGGDMLAPAPPPPLPPEVLNAQAIIADVQQGMARRQLLKKFGKTLELVYADAMRRQLPLDFKSGMKSVVRRACTTGAAYVEIGFQREYGVPPDVQNELDDCRDRLKHLEKLAKDVADGKIGDTTAEMDELNKSVVALEAKPQVCIRVGLTFKWIQATKVIPDRHCVFLGGFLGGDHITIEEIMSKKKAEERFNHPLGSEYTPYNLKGTREGEMRGVDWADNDYRGVFEIDRRDEDMVCVYKHYHKPSGLVYWLCEGHGQFLTPPAAPAR